MDLDGGQVGRKQEDEYVPDPVEAVVVVLRLLTAVAYGSQLARRS